MSAVEREGFAMKVYRPITSARCEAVFAFYEGKWKLRYDTVDRVFHLFDLTQSGFRTVNNDAVVKEIYARRINELPQSCRIAPANLQAGRTHRVELLESRHGYNIVALGDRFVAVQQSLGRIDFTKERLGDRDLPPSILTGPSKEALQQRLADLAARQGKKVELFLRKYEIVPYRGGMVAYQVALGTVAIGEEFFGDRELLPYLFVRASVEELRARIDAEVE